MSDHGTIKPTRFSSFGGQLGGESKLVLGPPVLIVNGHIIRNQTEADAALRDGLIDFPVEFVG